MKDYDVYKLETAEEIDAAFAATFGLRDPLDWAQRYDQNAVTDFLEGLTGERKVQNWMLQHRHPLDGEYSFAAEVSSFRYWGNYAGGMTGEGFAEFAAHALMKAAISWDQRRREQKREKVAAKRQTAREAAQP